MSWFIAEDVGEFLAEAGEFLHAEPVRNSVVLTVTENLRVKVAAQSPPAAPQTRAPGPDRPLFGWWRPPTGPDPQASPDPVGAVFMHTLLRAFWAPVTLHG